MSARAGRNTALDSAIVVIAVLSGAAACRPKAAPPAPPPPEVAVVTVTPGSVAQSFELTGEVVPFRRVEVRSRVEGIIEARPFVEGAQVRPGQVLYRLDRVRYEAAYQSALARYENAKRLFERLAPLVAQHAVAQQDVDNARSDLDAAQATLVQARKDLDDTAVKAEIAGRVGRTLMEVGARVTGPADLLATIDQLDPAYVSFRPSTEQAMAWRRDPRARALVQPGGKLAVKVTLPDGSILPRTGRLDFVAPSLDRETGTQEFRAQFANADRLLVPGQFVRVTLAGFVRDSAIAVPQRAVLQALGRQYVYVVGPGDTVQPRDVTPGPWSGSLWIIEKGLAAGDRVIVDGTQKAAPGRVVKPVPLADTTMHASSAVPATGARQ